MTPKPLKIDGFAYQANGIWSQCDLTIARAEGHVWILWRERADNPGPSVTNAAESLADEIWEAILGFHDPQAITWLETYDGEAVDVVIFGLLPRVSRADDGRLSVSGRFAGPSWRRLSLNERPRGV